MRPRLLLDFLQALRLYVQSLPTQDQPNPQVSLVSRIIIFQLYRFLLITLVPYIEPQQMRILNIEFAHILRIIHQKFRTEQQGSYLQYPQ
jgi:hypothetical protein